MSDLHLPCKDEDWNLEGDHCHPRRTFVDTCDTALDILLWTCIITSLAAASETIRSYRCIAPPPRAIGLINAHAFIAINTRSRFTVLLINSRSWQNSQVHGGWYWRSVLCQLTIHYVAKSNCSIPMCMWRLNEKNCGNVKIKHDSLRLLLLLFYTVRQFGCYSWQHHIIRRNKISYIIDVLVMFLVQCIKKRLTG